MTALGIADSIALWIIHLALPLAILICGTILFLFVKVKRLLIGAFLLLFGFAETLFFILGIEATLSMVHYIPVGLVIVTLIALATIIIGIISLYKSK